MFEGMMVCLRPKESWGRRPHKPLLLARLQLPHQKMGRARETSRVRKGRDLKVGVAPNLLAIVISKRASASNAIKDDIGRRIVLL